MRCKGWLTPELSSATSRPVRHRPARAASEVPRQLRIVHGPRMSQQISADAEQGCNPDVVPAADAPDYLRSESQTALQCLARVAAHHGVDLPVERLRHAYALGGAPI